MAQSLNNNNKELQKAIYLSNKKIYDLKQILSHDYNILPNIDKEVIQTTNANGSCLLYAIEQSLPNQYDYPLSEDHHSYNLNYLMKGGRKFIDDIEWARIVREEIVNFFDYKLLPEQKMKFISLYSDFSKKKH